MSLDWSSKTRRKCSPLKRDLSLLAEMFPIPVVWWTFRFRWPSSVGKVISGRFNLSCLFPYELAPQNIWSGCELSVSSHIIYPMSLTRAWPWTLKLRSMTFCTSSSEVTPSRSNIAAAVRNLIWASVLRTSIWISVNKVSNVTRSPPVSLECHWRNYFGSQWRFTEITLNQL